MEVLHYEGVLRDNMQARSSEKWWTRKGQGEALWILTDLSRSLLSATVPSVSHQ